MGELRAYALAVAEVRALAGAEAAQQQRLRGLARKAFAPARRVRVSDATGPLYRRVPGTRVLRDDDPTPEDLDALLAGSPVPTNRATATWRLVEALVSALAHDAVVLPDTDLPPGLLRPTHLAVPAVDGLTVGWCTREEASALGALAGWLEGRPELEVIVFHARAT